MISAEQIRTACSFLGWTALQLARAAIICCDEAEMAQDDVKIRNLGGLQLTAIRNALQMAGAPIEGSNDAAFQLGETDGLSFHEHGSEV